MTRSPSKGGVSGSVGELVTRGVAKADPREEGAGGGHARIDPPGVGEHPPGHNPYIGPIHYTQTCVLNNGMPCYHMTGLIKACRY